MHKHIFVVDGARTPFGSFGGSFKDTSAIELGTVAARGAMDRAGVEPRDIDQVFFGNVIQTSADAIYMARHVGLKSGVPEPVVSAILEKRRPEAGDDRFGLICDAVCDILASGH